MSSIPISRDLIASSVSKISTTSREILTKSVINIKLLTKSIVDWTKSFKNEIQYVKSKSVETITEEELDKYDKFPEIKDNTKALVLLLHGMNGSGRQFANHLKLLDNEENKDKFAIYMPKILDGGMNDINLCIENLMINFKQPSEDLPIFLIGISNGGRIALGLYPILTLYSKYVYISTIGTPIK